MNLVLLLRSIRAPSSGEASGTRIGCHEARALRLGRQLRDAYPGSHLTVLTAGDESEDPVLLEVLAHGADRACRLWDPLIAQVDALGVARALAAAIQHIGFDLVLTGARSWDESLGFMGPAIGEALSIPHLADVLEVEWSDTREAVVAERCAATRQFRHVLALPCLITVQGSSTETLTDTAEAPTDLTPQVLSLAEVGMDEALLRPRSRLHGELRPFTSPPYVTAWAEDATAVMEHLRDLDLL